MFERMRVKSLITLCLAVLGLLMVAIGCLGIYNGNNASSVIQETSLKDMRSDASIARIKFRMEMMRGQVLLALQHSPTSPYAKMHDHPLDLHLNAIKDSQARINQLWQQYLPNIATADEKRLANEWFEKSGKFGLTNTTAAAEFINSGKWDEAQQILLTKINPEFNAGQSASLVLADYLDKRATNNVELVSSTLQKVLYIMISAILLGILISIATSVLLVRIIYGQLGGEPRYAAEIVKNIAAGDLTVSIGTRPNDKQSLLFDMSVMRNRLADIIGNIRHGSETIATASSQIATGNQDLSSRTEEQASSLEETASSMEELTSTVRQNSENANQANQLAIAAADVAVKGGDVVHQVVETMNAINDSSKKMADIINVIDGIAFQTNILALNAAVEAARAGEQGRGFAVVATEVRNLAQRSASAAREIKVLIDDSVGKVEQGSRLVDQAGTTMTEVVTSIKRVQDIMAEITAASREQTDGIEQVNQAVMQMDQVTQQNAALVEEAAAAAEAMQDQASGLVQLVSTFRTGQDSAILSAPTKKAASPASRTRQIVAAAHTNRPVVRKTPAPLLGKPAGENRKGEDWEEF